MVVYFITDNINILISEYFNITKTSASLNGLVTAGTWVKYSQMMSLEL